MEFLKEECYAFENHLSTIDLLLNDTDRDIVKIEVEKLAGSLVEGRVRAFIDKRTGFAADTRADQRDHFAEKRH
jgi:hypothetical protein